jgi:hypothetical protein
MSVASAKIDVMPLNARLVVVTEFDPDNPGPIADIAVEHVASE